MSTSELSRVPSPAGDGTDGSVARVTPVCIALVNDHELVVRGLQRMLEEFEDRIRVVELDVNVEVAQPVDVALYDTFSVPQVTAERHRRPHRPAAGWPRWPSTAGTCTRSWSSEALEKGVRGYLSKSLQGHELVGRHRAGRGR